MIYSVYGSLSWTNRSPKAINPSTTLDARIAGRAGADTLTITYWIFTRLGKVQDWEGYIQFNSIPAFGV
ncbi:Uncharacterized protein HZ326_23277 [Fusarium oxysporum f. sp. albedinis]|nr:Uncharacterized protein HZ326_23277 [Fusarium oxysporum f. sp. albedinis]